MLISTFIKAMQAAGEPDWLIEKMIKGVCVRVTYGRPWFPGRPNPNAEDNRIKTIQSWPGGDPHTQHIYEVANQPMQKGRTAWEFFKQTYTGFSMSLPTMGCVNVGAATKFQNGQLINPQKLLWIPPEFLEIVDGQLLGRNVEPKMMSNMIEVARRPPAVSLNLIANEGLPHLGIESQELSANFHMSIDENFISISARFLDPPTIQHDGSAESAIKTPDKASWDLK